LVDPVEAAVVPPAPAVVVTALPPAAAEITVVAVLSCRKVALPEPPAPIWIVRTLPAAIFAADTILA
jgi:hypothetical protein